MKKTILALSLVISAGIIAGCNKGDSTPAANSPAAAAGAPPATQTQSQAISSNPRIPEAAKRGIMGGGGAPAAPGK